MIESYIDIKRKLFSHVQNLSLNDEVVDLLLPNGAALENEDDLWDYKNGLPTAASFEKHCGEDSADQEYQHGRLIRNIVGFYNSYGGYILAGVDNSTRNVIGCSVSLDTDKLRQRLSRATGQEIAVLFRRVERNFDNLGEVSLGLIFIPRRPDDRDPAEFKREGPKSTDGKVSYARHGIYLRKGHEVRAQNGMEDMRFLLVPNRRRFDPPSFALKTTVLDHNVIFHDKTISEIIQRDAYISKLWEWLTDRFNAVKLLAGPGGVGKTTIAGIFAKEILFESPMGFQKVIWLSAKTKFFRPLDGGEIQANHEDETERPRYWDIKSLFLALLDELGFIETDIDPEWNLNEFFEKTLEALTLTPSFVVIDDIDSLNAQEQYDLFQTVTTLFGRTLTKSPSSRALLTARVNLGAATSQRLEIKGFELVEFTDYVFNLCKESGLTFNPIKDNGVIRRFHEVSSGSPLFASAIVSLVANHVCNNIPSAIEQFKGRDGEDVRRFAYERELKGLSDSQLRLLFAVIELGESTLPELESIVESSRTLLSSNLTILRQHHLVAFATGAPGPDEVYAAPQSLRLMRDIIRSQISSPTALERACKNARSETRQYGVDAGRIINRVIGHWRNDEAKDALDVAMYGDKAAKGKHPDIKCILGRAFLRLDHPDCHSADAAFRASYDLGCERDELFPLWIEAKMILGDWKGVIEKTQTAEHLGIIPISDLVLKRAEARRELASILAKSGNTTEALSYLSEGFREISKIFSKKQASGRVNELREMQTALHIEYIDLLDRWTKSSDCFQVWDSVCEAFDNHCRKSFLFRTGLRALERWWNHVETFRSNPHPNTAARMEMILESIDAYRSKLINVGWRDDVLLTHMEETRSKLTVSLHRYRNSINPS